MMADSLLDEWEKFNLTEEESRVVGEDFEGVDDEDQRVQISLTLVGKLLTGKPFNFEALKRTLTSVWSLKDGVAIRAVDSNLFVFQFFSSSDKERVTSGCPWTFKEQVLLLKEINGDEQPSEVIFDKAPFWIRLVDVPFNRRNVNVAYDVGEDFGGFIDYDDSDPLGWEEEMRIKVLLEIDKPLRRGVTISTGRGRSKWVDVKYERIGDLCFYCGRLGHMDRECQFHGVAPGSNSSIVYQYGPYLRASPTKRRNFISLSEREQQKKWMMSTKKDQPRPPSYRDPNVVRLGPPGAARRLYFASPKGQTTREDVVSKSIQRSATEQEVSSKGLKRASEEVKLPEDKDPPTKDPPIAKFGAGPLEVQPPPTCIAATAVEKPPIVETAEASNFSLEREVAPTLSVQVSTSKPSKKKWTKLVRDQTGGVASDFGVNGGKRRMGDLEMDIDGEELLAGKRSKNSPTTELEASSLAEVGAHQPRPTQ